MKSSLKVLSATMGILLISMACATTSPTTARVDEATGTILETSYGAFKLDANGTDRFFKLAMRSTLYAPETWRPTKGDRVQVKFKVNNTELVVNRIELIAPGPDTIGELDNPVAVEIVEEVRAFASNYMTGRILSGQTIRFATGGTRWDPVGWLPKPGEKAVVEFRAKKQLVGYGVDFVALKVTKVD